MNKNLLFGIILLISGITFGQYTPEKEKFFKEFEKNLKESGKGDFKDFLKDELEPMLLETGDFPENIFQRMVATCNLIEGKRLKVYPATYYYVYSVTQLVKSKRNESLQAWHASVDKMLDSKSVKKFNEFMEFSSEFFESGIIVHSKNHIWYYRDGEYAFNIDDGGITVDFKGGNLVCLIPSGSVKDENGIDSICVINTVGTLDPIIQNWEGRGGKMTWEKRGLDPDKTFALLEGYRTNLKRSDFRVDTVTMTTTYFDRTLKGSLSDDAKRTNDKENPEFPNFLSFESELLIQEIIPDVDYVGGFALNGARFVGKGSGERPAEISVKKGGNPFISVKSFEIRVSDKTMDADRAECVIRLSSGDSIYHPGLRFTLDRNNNKVDLSRTKSALGQSPFIDSYHQLDAYVPKIIWDRATDRLEYTFDFGTSRDQRVAKFESRDYFNAQQYDQMQGSGLSHPLAAIWEYCYKYDEYVLTEGKAATALGGIISDVKPLLLEISAMGFISYDTEKQIIIVNPKLENYVKAKSGTKDYDNIIFVTDLREKELKGYTREQIQESTFLRHIDSLNYVTNEQRRLLKSFGIMDLSTLDLDLVAVDFVQVSEITNTVAFPDNAEVKVRKNRDFTFTGWLNSGKAEIHTLACNFDYEENKFKVLKSDDALFRVRPLSERDGFKSIATESHITGISGELYVNHPSDRSGLNKKEVPEYTGYPKLDCTSRTKVFYNDQRTFGGAYDSTRFYYTIYPFEMDSLNEFDEKSLRFKGELVSAGIFPIIEEPLKIMPDYSFGFGMETPKGGLTFYGTEAKYDSKIVLSMNGLQGSGIINFIESTSESSKFNFLPDSTVGLAKFDNNPVQTGTQFPEVRADAANVTYIPRQNVLRATSLPKRPLSFFGGEADMKGTAIVTPKGMRGEGLINFANATMVSTDYSFKYKDIDADTASFSLKNDDENLDEDPMVFKTHNCKSHVSFIDRKGSFISNDGTTEHIFPVNQYLCRMDVFLWNMDDYTIEMRKKAEKEGLELDAGVDLIGSNFYSTHPKQDSLNFRAPKAKFHLKDKTIECKDVDYIDVADARIYPDSGMVFIRKKAKMDELKNSKIVANYVTKYHTFIEADVQIKAKRDYSGQGKYPYYDRDSNVYFITMEKIDLDTAFQTRAFGKVTDKQGFKLSDEFEFYGDANIKADYPGITFKGATRIIHECEKFDRNWMAFTAEIDPKNIQIPVSEDMKDLNGDPVTAGIVWHTSEVKDSTEMYPAFLSSLKSDGDEIVIKASGFLQYDANVKEYQISSKEKLNNRGETGNYIALNTKTCSMEGDGVISLGMDFGVPVVETVGKINYHQETGETTMNLTAKFDMPLEKGFMQNIASAINEVEGVKGPRDLRGVTIEQALVEWSQENKQEAKYKNADDFKKDYLYGGGKVKVSPEINQSIVITGLKLKAFNRPGETKGLVTYETNATLVNFYGTPMMKEVPVRAYFTQNFVPEKKDDEVDGDGFILNISVPGGSNYWFYYVNTKKDASLDIISSDPELAGVIDAIKEEKRKVKNFHYQSNTSTTPELIFRRIFK